MRVLRSSDLRTTRAKRSGRAISPKMARASRLWHTFRIPLSVPAGLSGLALGGFVRAFGLRGRPAVVVEARAVGQRIRELASLLRREDLAELVQVVQALIECVFAVLI